MELWGGNGRLNSPFFFKNGNGNPGAFRARLPKKSNNCRRGCTGADAVVQYAESSRLVAVNSNRLLFTVHRTLNLGKYGRSQLL